MFNLILVVITAIAMPARAQYGGGEPAVTVETAQVIATDLENSVEAVGTLLADASATLRAEVPGQILAVHFSEGSLVAKGAKLYSIEATVLEAEVNEARANAERSEAAYERARELHAKRLISATDFDTARANYDVDVARLLSSRA
ncbi:MAG: hypothetical protein OEM63_15975, partial [Gammaproteobacteria bacterium]|nr:hypothetical protein [Gammaproteobacteria bacterium]